MFDYELGTVEMDLIHCETLTEIDAYLRLLCSGTTPKVIRTLALNSAALFKVTVSEENGKYCLILSRGNKKEQRGHRDDRKER